MNRNGNHACHISDRHSFKSRVDHEANEKEDDSRNVHKSANGVGKDEENYSETTGIDN